MLEEDARTDKNTAAFTYTDSTIGIFDKYKFTLTQKTEPSKTKTEEKAEDDKNHFVIFTDLTPGTIYSLKAVTVSGTEESDPISPVLEITTGILFFFHCCQDCFPISLCYLVLVFLLSCFIQFDSKFYLPLTIENNYVSQ